MFGIWLSSRLLNEDFLLSGGGISILVWKSPDRFSMTPFNCFLNQFTALSYQFYIRENSEKKTH